jgi:hypothetical protein
MYYQKQDRPHSYRVILWCSGIFLVRLKRSWIFSTNIPESLQYRIARKSFQYEPNLYMRTDGQARRSQEVTHVTASKKLPKTIEI